MDEYESLIRELARDPRALTYKDIAIVVRKWPEIPGEAVADEYEGFAEVMANSTPSAVVALGQFVLGLVRRKCTDYLDVDVPAMRAQIELEDREDDTYTRRAV